MVRFYSYFEKKINQARLRLQQILAGRPDKMISQITIKLELFFAFLFLLILEGLNSIIKFFIFIFSHPTTSFTVFFRPSTKEPCPHSFIEYKARRRKAKLFSFLGAAALVVAVVAVSFSPYSLFGYQSLCAAGAPCLNAGTAGSIAPARSDSRFRIINDQEGRKAELMFSTDRPATCRYAAYPNADYLEMTETAQTDEQRLVHTITTGGLGDGEQSKYFTRCQDAAGNRNQDDYALNFSVKIQDGTPIYMMKK